MFKNIQKKLLLKYPLVWNTKLVPMFIIGSILNVIYFSIGYANGFLDFSETANNALHIEEFSIYGVFINSILVVIWLIYYFRNNSFASFYKRKTNSLFYEFVQIFGILLLFSIFPIFYIYGFETKQRSYISEKELIKEIDIVCKADFFIDGNYASTQIDSLNSTFTDSTKTELENIVYKDYNYYFGNPYNEYSLMNRTILNFDYCYYYDYNFLEECNKYEEKFFTDTQKIREYLATKNIKGIKKIMSDYLSVVKKYNLKTNLTTDIWFTISYDYPTFNSYELIKPYLKINEVYQDNYYATTQAYEGSENYSDKNYSKYYVQHSILKKNLEIIYKAFKRHNHTYEIFVFVLIFSFCLSLLVFSLRITTFRNWLLSILFSAFLGLVFGIVAVSLDEFYDHPIPVLIFITLGVLFFISNAIYYFFILSKNTTKKLSTYSLNILIWSFAFIIPLIVSIFLIYIDEINNSNDYNVYFNVNKFLNHYAFHLMFINVLISFVLFYFLTKTIHKWKGISEE